MILTVQIKYVSINISTIFDVQKRSCYRLPSERFVIDFSLFTKQQCDVNEDRDHVDDESQPLLRDDQGTIFCTELYECVQNVPEPLALPTICLH